MIVIFTLSQCLILGPVDAIAEFVDNSIQACRDVIPERRIDLKFFYDPSDLGSSFFVIFDNGCGLNVEEIQAFATFSLDKKTRGQAPTDEKDTSFISKFGVGSKQAGFFLGDRITVVSKKKDDELIYKFHLDAERFQHKYQSKENVYYDHVMRYNANSIQERKQENELFVDEVEATSYMLTEHVYQHIKENKQQFAIFIIKLRPEIRQKLLQKRIFVSARPVPSLTQLPLTMTQGVSSSDSPPLIDSASTTNTESELMKELGDVYYFHLHPDHHYDKLEKLFPKSANNTCRRQKIRHTSSDSSELPPLLLTYREFDGNHLIVEGNINNTNNCFISQCLKKAEDVFGFELSIPDVSALSSSSLPQASFGGGANFTQKGTTQQSQFSSSDSPSFTLHGYILYFPVVNGVESIPQFSSSTSQAPATPSNMRMTQHQQLMIQQQENENSQQSVGLTNQSFRVFWVNRLVPEAVVDRLNFFPAREIMKMDDHNMIEKNWKQRIVCFLFLHWDFPYISNNKLKICLEPNLWINHTGTKAEHPRGAPEKFKKWIKDCYKQYDKEFIFSNRLLEEEDALQRLNPRAAQFSRFGTVILRVNEEDGMLEINQGEDIKWYIKDCLFIGKVLYFSIHKSLPRVEHSYSGMGDFTYQRLPIETYGETEYVASLDCIDINDFRPKKPDYAKLEKITSVKVFLFQEVGSTPEELFEDSQVTAGVKYYKMGIQIFNNNGMPMISLPQMRESQRNKDNRYYVNLATNNHVIGETSELYQYDELKREDMKVLGSSLKDKSIYGRCYFSFYEITFHQVGKILLNITVKLPDGHKTPVFTQRITIMNTAPIIENVRITNLKRLESTVLTLGDYLPSFGVQLLDFEENPSPYSGSLKVMVTSVNEDHVMVTKNPKSSGDILDLTDQHQFEVETDIWQPLPTKNTVLFNKEEYIRNKQFTFKLQLLQPLGNEPSASGSKKAAKKYQLIGQDLFFTLTIRPGLPSALTLLYPQETTLLLKNYEIIERLVLGCVDEWGNRTNPMILEEFVSNLSGEFIEEEKDWQLILGEAPLQDIEDTRVAYENDSGCFEITSLQCCYNGTIPFEGKKVHQDISISSEKYEQYLKRVRELRIPIKIFPRFIPSKLIVHHQNQIISELEQAISVQPGDVLSEMVFQILTEDGKPLAEEEYQNLIQEGKSNHSWINCSWVNLPGASGFRSKKKKYPPLPEDRHLPSITIPTRLLNTSSAIDYSVEVSCNGILLKAEFSVSIEAEDATAWNIVYDSHASATLSQQAGTSANSTPFQGILLRNNDYQDFFRKVLGMCLVDRFGNGIQSKRFLAGLSPPILSILRVHPPPPTQEDEEENTARMEVDDREELCNLRSILGAIVPPKFHIASSQRSEAFTSQVNQDELDVGDPDSLYGFILPKEEVTKKLQLQLPIGTRLILKAHDVDSRYDTCEINATIIAGYPAFMAIACPALSTEAHPTTSLKVEISRYTKLTDLRIFLFDIPNMTEEQLQKFDLHQYPHDNPYKPDFTNIRNVTVEIYESYSRKRIYQKKNCNQAAEIFIPSIKYDFNQIDEIIQSLSPGSQSKLSDMKSKGKNKKKKINSKSEELFPDSEEEETGENEEVIKQEHDSLQIRRFKHFLTQGILCFEVQLSFQVDEGIGREKWITMPAAELLTKVIHMNNVTSLSLVTVQKTSEMDEDETTDVLNTAEAWFEEEVTDLRGGIYHLSYTAGSFPDSLFVKFHTDDEAFLCPELDQVTIEVIKMPLPAEKSKKSSSSASEGREVLSAQAVFDISIKELPGSKGILLVPKTDFWSSHTACRYSCSLNYEETRAGIKSILPLDLLHKDILFNINIQPGEIKNLVLDKHSELAFEKLSLMMNKHSEHRCFGENITFTLADSYLNVCNIYSNYQLQCFIQKKKKKKKGNKAKRAKRESVEDDLEEQDEEEVGENDGGRDDEEASTISKKRKHDQVSREREDSFLEEANDNDCDLVLENGEEGIVKAKILNTSPQKFCFPVLRFKFDPGYNSQHEDPNRFKYELCFVLQEEDGETGDLITRRKKKITFQLMNNQHLLTKKKAMQSKYQEYFQMVEEYDSIREKIRNCNLVLGETTETLPPAILHIEDDIPKLRILLSKREEELRYMESHCTQARRVRKATTGADMLMKLHNLGVTTYKGMVVDLAYVDDLQEARVISWAAKEVIDAAVVQTTKEGTVLYKAGIPTMIIDQAPMFQFQDRDGNRRYLILLDFISLAQNFSSQNEECKRKITA